MTREVSQARDNEPSGRRNRAAIAGMTCSGEVQMHRYRITFLSGFAAGFVLGARAGRERYEQIVRVARSVADSPAAQQAAGAVQAQAAGLAKTAKQKVTDGLQDRVPKLASTAKDKVSDRVPGMRQRNGHKGRDGDAGAPGNGPVTAANRHNT
jgi:hypothetical protein